MIFNASADATAHMNNRLKPLDNRKGPRAVPQSYDVITLTA